MGRPVSLLGSAEAPTTPTLRGLNRRSSALVTEKLQLFLLEKRRHRGAVLGRGVADRLGLASEREHFFFAELGAAVEDRFGKRQGHRRSDAELARPVARVRKQALRRSDPIGKADLQG